MSACIMCGTGRPRVEHPNGWVHGNCHLPSPGRDVVPLTKHPAKFSAPVLETLRHLVRRETQRIYPALPNTVRAIDTFAGIGGVHALDDLVLTIGVELQPRWAACHRRTYVGDATRLPRGWRGKFGLWITSPCYGNRYRDHHQAKDACKRCDGDGVIPRSLVLDAGTDPCDRCGGSGLSVRRSYTHDYGEPLEDGNAGVMRFGTDAYAELHLAAYAEAFGALQPGGGALLNVSDFVENKAVVDAVSWHRYALVQAGFQLRQTVPVTTRRMKYGANRERVAHEVVLVARKPEEQ